MPERQNFLTAFARLLFVRLNDRTACEVEGGTQILVLFIYGISARHRHVNHHGSPWRRCRLDSASPRAPLSPKDAHCGGAAHPGNSSASPHAEPSLMCAAAPGFHPRDSLL